MLMQLTRVFLLILIGCLALNLAQASTTSGYGPETVYQEAGYITVPGPAKDYTSNLWYWFFESRNNPDTSPLIIWLTGGPGCSGTFALLSENGPYHVNSDLSLSINPYSWNSIANVIWIDQPVNTGFSYSTNPHDYVSNENQVSVDLYDFIQAFLAKHPKFQKSPFYITGESFGGHYIPHFASYIVKQNANLAPTSNLTRINLRGVSIGNGWVNPLIQYKYYSYYMYQMNLLKKFEYNLINLFYPACRNLLLRRKWVTAFYTCNIIFEETMLFSSVNAGYSINPYNIDIPCVDGNLCYNIDKEKKFLSSPQVLKALNVSKDIHSWSSCNTGVYRHMLGDFEQSFSSDVTYLLENNITVLTYSGVLDMICNHLGNRAWLMNLSWSKIDNWQAAQPVQWTVNNVDVGESISYENLMFYKVYKAGHMVPMDQPEAALDLIQKMLAA